MKDKIAKASRVIADVRLNSIRLIGVNARSGIRAPSDVDNVQINFAPSAHLSGLLENGVFYVSASIRFEIRDGETLNPVVDVSADYELEYALPEGADYEKEELMSFAQVNGVFNVWPYWRELIQSTLVRMNLPPVPLPMFRVPQQQQKGQADANTRPTAEKR